MAALLEATAAAEVASARALFDEYMRSVAEPACFAGFERELAQLPRGYLLILLAREPDGDAGCVALRALDSRSAEMKRLYVRPQFRGRGLGRALAEGAIDAARSRRYQRMVLDSLPQMRAARALYRELGFRAIPPYLAEPTPGATCFELRL